MLFGVANKTGDSNLIFAAGFTALLAVSVACRYNELGSIRLVLFALFDILFN